MKLMKPLKTPKKIKILINNKFNKHSVRLKILTGCLFL